MKRRIVFILLLSAVVLSMLSAQASLEPEKSYTPMTREQAKAWLGSITMEQLEDFVIRYDYIEHSIPVFSDFKYLAIVTGKDVFIQPIDPTIELTIGSDTMGLKYKLALPSFTYKDIVPKEDTFLRDAGIGAAAATFVFVAVSALVGGK